MLRTNAPTPKQPRRGSAAMLLLLAVAAVGLTALRDPTDKDTSQPPPEPRPVADTRPALPPQKHAPFDLSYLPPGAQGVVAFRPAAIFGRPDMKDIAEKLDRELAGALEKFGVKQGQKLSVRDIDQVVAQLVVRTNKQEKGLQTGLLTGCPMVLRTKRDFDWKALLYAVAPNTVPVEHSGKRYHKAPAGALPVFSFGPDCCYYIPDARTIVIDTEENIRKLLERGNKTRPADPWAEDWKRVERGLIAIAFDNRDKRWLTGRRQPEKDMPAPEVALFKQATTLVCGVHDIDGVFVEVGIRCDTVEASNGIAKACTDLLTLAAKLLEAEQGEKPADKTAERFRKNADEFLRSMKVHHTPDAVWVWVKGDWGLRDLLHFSAEEK